MGRPFRCLGCLVIPVLMSCGDGNPPAVPRLDSGPDPLDGGSDGDVIGEERGDAAILPPADTDVQLSWDGPAAEVDLAVDADLGKLDVVFSVDTTSSFNGEINNLQSELTSFTIPTLRKRVLDTAFGVSHFEDFAKSPFGDEGDHPFELLTPVTLTRSRVASAVAGLDMPLGIGGDFPEAGAEALYQLATGEGYPKDTGAIIAPFTYAGGEGELGGAGFRRGALHVIVHVTDAPSHVPADYAPTFKNVHSLDDAVDAMKPLKIKVIGIASSTAAREDLTYMAEQTGAVLPATDGECKTGLDGAARLPNAQGKCPLVFDVARDGQGLSRTLVDGIVNFVNGVAFDEVHAEAVDNRLSFVESIEATEAEVTDDLPPPTLADRLPPFDGEPDTFEDVRQGVRVHFRVRLSNHTVKQTDEEQAFRVTVRVVSDDLVLATKVIRVRVPALAP